MQARQGCRLQVRYTQGWMPCIILLWGFLGPFCLENVVRAEVVGKWKQFRKVFVYHGWQGNPHDLSFQGLFTSPSGKQMRHHGFYDGQDKWKIYFMPNEVGRWTYRTVCAAETLDGLRGAFECVPSDLKGSVLPDPLKPNRWKTTEGDHVMPLIWGVGSYHDGRAHFRAHGADHPLVMRALMHAREVRATWLHTCAIVLKRDDWAEHFPMEAMPYLEGKEGIHFNPVFWDNLNSRMDAARDLDMGAYVMLYTDDGLRPDRLGIRPHSAEERRLYRYLMARLAPYPLILWDSGIDISEYRDAVWIDDFTDWFHQNDPWRHPVSSRHGGGSGSVIPARQTYESLGGAFLPSRADLLLQFGKPFPTAHTDHWRIFIPRGAWDNDKIRKALWRCALSGGQAPFPDYSQGPFEEDAFLQGKKSIVMVMRFIAEELRHGLGGLEPDDAIIIRGEGAIVAHHPGYEVLVFNETPGSFSLDLSRFDAHIRYRWLNTKNGRLSMFRTMATSSSSDFSPPQGCHESVLHILRTDVTISNACESP